jgi:hypothetical protein
MCAPDYGCVRVSVTETFHVQHLVFVFRPQRVAHRVHLRHVRPRDCLRRLIMHVQAARSASLQARCVAVEARLRRVTEECV